MSGAARDPRGIGAVPDGLQAALPEAVGEDLYRFLEQTRRLLRDYVDNKADVLARIAAAASITSAPGPAGVPGPPGPPAAPATPDVTPPPTPSGAVVTAGLNTIFIETDDPVPIVTQGHGYQRTLVYGSTLASPTFLDAVLVHEFEGPLGSFSSNLGVAWKIWLTWKTNDGVESTTPSGGAGGHLATTGKIGTADLNDLIVTAGKLADGSITGPKLAVGSVDAAKLALEMGGGNLLSNSSFEVDSDANGLSDSWTSYTAGTTGAITNLMTSSAVRGSLAQRVQAAALAAGTGNHAGVSQTLFGTTLVYGSRKMVLSAYVAASIGRTAVVELAWLDASGVLISSATATATGTGNFQRLVVSATTASNAARVRALIYVRNGAGALAEIVVDAAQLEFGDVATAYAPRPDELLPNVVVNANIAADAVQALQIAAGAVTAAKTTIAAIDSGTGNLTANSVTAGTIQAGAVVAGKIATDAVVAANILAGSITTAKIAAGAVTANEISANAVTSGKIAAGAIVAGKIAAGAVGATEIAAGAITTNKLLVTGKGMALNDDPGTSDISAWTVSGTASVVTLTDGVAGNAAIRLSGANPQVASRPFQATAGRQYRVICYARKTSGSGTLRLRAVFKTATGSITNLVVTAITPVITNFENIAVAAPWVKYIGTITADPSSVSCYLEALANIGAGTGDTEIQDFRCEEYITGDVIVDGTIAAVHLAANSVTATKIAANAIAVGTAAIQNGAIVNAMIGAAAIDTAKIANAAITTALIADLNVTGAKIANATITTAKIATAQITTALIADANITGAKIASATITDANIASLNADKITAGAIRGINVNAASHTTKGSYLTASTSGGESTINVKDTTDFPSSGNGEIIDTTNDRDSFAWTGKTATTLTGCSNVLAHNNGATVVPLIKNMVIDSATNEMRFFADLGSGVIAEVAAIGISATSDRKIIQSGRPGYDGIGLFAENLSLQPTIIATQNGIGAALRGSTSFSGNAVEGLANGTGHGGVFQGNTTRAPLLLSTLNGRPTNRANGSVAIINTTGGTTDNRTSNPRLMFADGTNWLLASDFSVWNG